MPIPKPQSGESQDEFVSRCISEIYEEYNDEKQVAAICYSKWRDVNLSKNERMRGLVNQMMNPQINKIKFFPENKTKE